MKRIVTIIGLAVSALALQTVVAQNSGAITYETKINMHRNIPPEREAMKAMVPEFRTSKNLLVFTANESLYKPIIEDEEEDMTSTQAQGGRTMVMRFGNSNSELYYDTDNQLALSSQEFMGKQYLITDSLSVSPWKFGTETKTILGYECKQAYFTSTEERMTMRVTGSGPPTPEKRTVTRDVTAWYTDKIRPALGPDRYYSLPGTVLAIDVNNGETVTVATKVELRNLKKNELKKPEKGEKITQREFRKQMEATMRGGGLRFGN